MYPFGLKRGLSLELRSMGVPEDFWAEVWDECRLSINIVFSLIFFKEGFLRWKYLVPFLDPDRAQAANSRCQLYRVVQTTETFSYRCLCQMLHVLLTFLKSQNISGKLKTRKKEMFCLVLFWILARLLTGNGTSVITFYSHWIAHLGYACTKMQSSPLQ